MLQLRIYKLAAPRLADNLCGRTDGRAGACAPASNVIGAASRLKDAAVTGASAGPRVVLPPRCAAYGLCRLRVVRLARCAARAFAAQHSVRNITARAPTLDYGCCAATKEAAKQRLSSTECVIHKPACIVTQEFRLELSLFLGRKKDRKSVV